MSFKIVSAILRGAWLIEPEYAQAHLPIVQNLFSGNFDGFSYKPNRNSEVYAVNQFKVGGRWTDFSEAPKGSFAVIPVTGPILKHDNCGDPGSMTRAAQIKDIDNNPNIEAIIFDIDSPGGMVDGTQSFADAIKNAKKPTIAFVNDGISASAAYWLASVCDEIYVSRKTDMVGSIGIYLTLMDPTKHYEDKGIIIHEIYAPESTEKNLYYKEALKGNYKPIQAELSFFAQTFIGAVKEGRGDKLNLSKGNPFTGKMYFADEAQAIGLIDGIKSLKEVLARADELTKKSETSNSTNNNSTNMNKKTYAAVNAVLGVETLEATEEGVFLNEDQLTAINESLAASENLVNAEAHQEVVEQLATANRVVESTKTTLTALATTAGVEIPEGDFNAESVVGLIAARVGELKSGPAAAHSTANPSGDDELDGTVNMTSLDNMAHNKAADDL